MAAVISLAEHNRRRMEAEAYRRRNDPHANGISCPACGEELWDSNPTSTLASNPPQKNVHCPSCGHTGYRLA